jgi:membrane-associated protease RseP (regulator of RpoE activity)
MKPIRERLAVVAVLSAGMLVASSRAAQPASQPYLFYSDESGNGSYLGVDTRDITPDRLGALHLKDESGVEVTMVDQDAPAGKAGLREHDVILSINDQKVESVEQLRRLIREIPAGRTVTIGISRAGQPMTFKAQLAERNKFLEADRGFDVKVPPINIPAIHIPPINMPEMDVPVNVIVIHSPVRSGLMVENLTSQLGDYFGVKSGRGVLVRSVEKGSRGEQAGFRAGDVIVKVNGSEVTDCSDFTRLLRERKESKVGVTVMRDRKEQVLSLSLPEPRRSGAVTGTDCHAFEQDACTELFTGNSELATLSPELWSPERLAGGAKQLERWNRERDELNKEMEKLNRDWRRQRQEMKEQMKYWLHRNSANI